MSMIWAIIATFAIYLGGNIYLFIRLLQAVVALPLWVRLLFSILFWFSAFALFLALGLRNVAMPEAVQRALFAVGSVWLVFLLYATLSLICCELLSLWLPLPHHGVWYAITATILLLTVGHINYRHPKVENLEIVTKNGENGSSMRLVAISDVHLGYGTNRADLRRYVELINAQQPDVVVIIGDLIDNSPKPVIADDMCAEFSRVHARMGVYMVAGNHEYISGIHACESYLAKSSIHLLRDSIATLPNGVQLICRDDKSNRERATLATLVEQANPTSPIIVLDHQPYDISESCRLGVDMHLSGHTHRGQVWPISWLTDLLFEQSYGYRKWNNTHAYVSSGISLWGPPFRIGTRSELVVIDLKW